MRKNSKKKRVMISAVACAALMLGMAGTYAILTDATGMVKNTFALEQVNTHIDEDLDHDPIQPNTDITKNVWIVNDGPSDAFIRARYQVSPANSEIVVSGMDVTREDGNGYWFDGGDGWYYYSDVVPAKETKVETKVILPKTTSLFTTVNFPAEIKENFDVTVYQEAVGTGKYNPGDDVPQDYIKKSFADVTK